MALTPEEIKDIKEGVEALITVIRGLRMCPPHNYQYTTINNVKRVIFCAKCGDVKEI